MPQAFPQAFAVRRADQVALDPHPFGRSIESAQPDSPAAADDHVAFAGRRASDESAPITVEMDAGEHSKLPDSHSRWHRCRCGSLDVVSAEAARLDRKPRASGDEISFPWVGPADPIAAGQTDHNTVVIGQAMHAIDAGANVVAGDLITRWKRTTDRLRPSAIARNHIASRSGRCSRTL